jgi:hypothetical protein
VAVIKPVRAFSENVIAVDLLQDPVVYGLSVAEVMENKENAEEKENMFLHIIGCFKLCYTLSGVKFYSSIFLNFLLDQKVTKNQENISRTYAPATRGTAIFSGPRSFAASQQSEWLRTVFK